MRETRLGWVASSMLKPIKNTSMAAPSSHSEGASPASVSAPSPACTNSTSTMASSKAERNWPLRSIANKRPKAANDNSTAGRYTCQCAVLTKPACTNIVGTATHMAICTVCKTNTPAFRRSKSG